MSDLAQMAAVAREALLHVLDLVPEDTVLIVTDLETRKIGEAFQLAAQEHGCTVQEYLLPEEDRPLAKLSAELKGQLAGKSVVLNLFQALASETPFRIQLILAIVATKAIRLGHAPGITEAMMTGGPLAVDYQTMRELAARLMDAFTDAVSVHITTPAGTDLVLGLANRPFVSDVGATVEKGCNLPCGEIYCAPEETKADGVLVVDGTIGGVDDVSRPIRVTLEGGKIVDLASDDPELVAAVEKLTGLDEEASVIGELGIGINPGAKLTGNMLEDEKAFRTAHIAFGNNSEFPGGQNNSQTHHDFLFRRPTFEVTYADGSRRVLLEDGEFRV
jgi:leucyl aminopeptidase (aminopeptidase T)